MNALRKQSQRVVAWAGLTGSVEPNRFSVIFFFQQRTLIRVENCSEGGGEIEQEAD